MAQKNHMFLLDVFAEVHKLDEKAQLVLLGDGELMEAVKQKAEKLSLEKNITFVGNVGNANEWYQAFDCFVLPSIWEGLPVVTQPYMLFYYCDGLPEVEKQKLIDYAHKNGMAVYGAGECDKRYTDITVNLTPFQWVWMFRNAACVVTGTFHGAVFSI